MQNRDEKIKIPVKFTEYLSMKAKMYDIPLTGTFELTSRCNFNCKMCYVHHSDCNKNEPYELSAEQWIEIGKTASEQGMVYLLLTGGEPLLRKDFPVIYKALAEMGFILLINSNGSLINDEIIELFKEYPPSRINITLYGNSNEEYKKICGVPAYDKVIENINRLKENNISTYINCTVCKYNKDSVKGIINTSQNLNLECNLTTYMYPPIDVKYKSGFDNIRLSYKDAVDVKLYSDSLMKTEEQYYFKLKKLAEYSESEDNECLSPFDDDADNENKIRCKAGKTSFWIDWKGNLSLCGMIKKDNSVLKKGFSQCWKDIRNFSDNLILPKKCVKCKYRNICFSCAATCCSETGGYDSPGDYVCNFIKYYAKRAKELSETRNER